MAFLLALWTGWLHFDPIVAMLVALNILWSGTKLLHRSIAGLMDEAGPYVNKKLREILQKQLKNTTFGFHSLRHRNAGNKLVIEFHLLFHKDIPIFKAHQQATCLEKAIIDSFPMQTEVTSHLEPIEGHDESHFNSDTPPYFI